MSFLVGLWNRRRGGGGGTAALLVVAGLALALTAGARGGDIVGNHGVIGKGALGSGTPIRGTDTVVVFDNDSQRQFGNSGSTLSLGSLTGTIGLDKILGGITDGVLAGLVKGLADTVAGLPALGLTIPGLNVAGSNISLGILNAGGGAGLGGGGGGGLLAGGGGYGGGGGGTLLGGGGGGLNVGDAGVKGGAGGLLLTTGDKGGIGGGGSGLTGVLDLDGILGASADGGYGDGSAGKGTSGGHDGIGGGNYLDLGKARENGSGGNGFGGGGGSNLALDSTLRDALAGTLTQGVVGGLLDSVLDLGVGLVTLNSILEGLKISDAISDGTQATDLLAAITDVVAGLVDKAVLDTLDTALGGLGISGNALGVAGGGGGGITQGGLGSNLLGGGGAGAGLGVSVDQDLRIDIAGNNQYYSADKIFDVQGGALDVFGGSGGGGGLTTALASGDQMNGKGMDLTKVTLGEGNTGGVVNLLGGTGGGGGLILGADGGNGAGSTLADAQIHSGTLNVYGGAGGGANITLLQTGTGLLGTNGGNATGAQLNGGTMYDGTVNIYAGANGGNMDASILQLAGVGDLLAGLSFANSDAEGKGGTGGGGKVSGFTLEGGTLNINAGTSATHQKALEDGTVKFVAGAGGEATASDITNKGGSVNLKGGLLTGDYYTQSGGELRLAGGTFDATAKNFSGGEIVSEVKEPGEIITGASFVGKTADGDGEVRAYATNGNMLTLTDAKLAESTAHLILDGSAGNGQVFLDATTIAKGTVSLIGAKSFITNSYTQNDGTLDLSGTTATNTANSGNITINAGSITASGTGSSTLAKGSGIFTIGGTGAVTATANGTANLVIDTANIVGSLTTTGMTTIKDALLDTANSKLVLGNGGDLSGTYMQTNGSLTLGGGIVDGATDITLSAGSVLATADSTLSATGKFIVDGAVTAGATGGQLILSGLNVVSGGTLTLGAGSTLGGEFQQDIGGGLLLGTNVVGAADSALHFLGGTIGTVGNAAYTLTGALIDGAVNATSGLSLDSAHLTGAASQLTLNAGSKIVGDYLQTAGTLILNAADNIATTTAEFAGGVISSTAGGTLNAGKITGDVIAKSTVGILEIGKDVAISTATGAIGNLILGSGSALADGYDLTTGMITLGSLTDGTGSLGTGFILDGGHLALGTGGTQTLTGADLISGTVEALVAGTTMAGITIDGALNFIADKGALTLDLQAGGLTDNGELTLGKNVTLTNLAQTVGDVILDGGSLGSGYSLDGGLLTIASGVNDAKNAIFNTGTITTIGEGGTLTGGKIMGEILAEVGEAGGSLLLDGVDMTADAVLTLGKDAMVGNLLHNVGDIVLDGGGLSTGYQLANGGLLSIASGENLADGAQFIGGTIESVGTGGSLVGGTFLGKVVTVATEGALNLVNSIIGKNGNLELGDGVSLTDGKLTDATSSLTLDAGSHLLGDYVQNMGNLILNGGNTDETDSATLSGGTVTSMIKDGILNNAIIDGKVDFLVDGAESTLTLAGATIQGSADLIIEKGVDLLDATMDTADGIIELAGGALTGDYLQKQGTLELGDGSYAGIDGGSLTFEGGVISTLVGETADLAGAIFNGAVTVGGTGTGDISLVDAIFGSKADVTLEAGSDLTNALLNTGKITLDGGSLLGDSFTMGGNAALDLITGTIDKDLTMHVAGGTISTSGGSYTLANDIIVGPADGVTSGLVTLGDEDGGTLTLTGALDILGGAVDVVGDTLLGGATTLEDGTLSLIGGGAKITGDYTQNDGKLVLGKGATGDNLDGAKSLTLNGGELDNQSGNEILIDLDNGNIKIGDDYTFGGVALTGEVKDGQEIGIRGPDGKFELKGDNAGTIVADGGIVTTILDTAATIAHVRVPAGGTHGIAYIQGNGTGVLTVTDLLVEQAREAVAGMNSIITAATVNAGKLVADIGSTILKATITDGYFTAERGSNVTTANLIGGVLELADGAGVTGMTTLASSSRNFSNIAINLGTAGGVASLGELSGTGILNFEVAGASNDRLVVSKVSGEYLVNAVGDTLGRTVDLIYAKDISVTSAASMFKLGGGGIREDGMHVLVDELIFAAVDAADVPDTGVLAPSAAVLKAADAQAEARVFAAASGDWVKASLQSRAAGMSSTAEGLGNAASIGLSQANIGMFELNRHFAALRDANQSWRRDNCLDPTQFNVWAQTYTHHLDVETMGSATMNMWGLDIGFDRQFDGFLDGSLYLGAVMGGQWLSSFKMDQSYGDDGQGEGDAFSLGLYGAWMRRDGWFASASVRHFWSDLDMTSYTASGTAAQYSPNRNVFAFSGEFGKKFDLSETWYVEPSVGLMATWMGSDRLRTSTGYDVSYSTTKALEGTAGVAVGYNGETVTPYIEAAVIHSLNGKTSVRFGADRFDTEMNGTRVRAGLGANMSLTRNISLYIDAAYETGSDYEDINGNFGINFSW